VVVSPNSLGCSVLSDGSSFLHVRDVKRSLSVCVWRYTPPTSTFLKKWIPDISIPSLLTVGSLVLLLCHHFLKKGCFSCCGENQKENEEEEEECDKECEGIVCEFVLKWLWSMLVVLVVGSLVMRLVMSSSKKVKSK